jgi:hypothetical protein
LRTVVENDGRYDPIEISNLNLPDDYSSESTDTDEFILMNHSGTQEEKPRRIKVAIEILNEIHELLAKGVHWGIITTEMAIAFWLDKIEAKDCTDHPEVSVTQDLAKQIFAGALFARMVPLGLLSFLVKKLTKAETKEDILDIVNNIEHAVLSSAASFGFFMNNPLLPQTNFAEYKYIPASAVATLPLIELFYRTFINRQYRPGAWQAVRDQYPENVWMARIITGLRSVLNAVGAASLTGVVTQFFFADLINAARDVDVPQEQVNVVAGILTAIFATLGAASVAHPDLLRIFNGINIGAVIFYAISNPAIAVLVCTNPEAFMPEMFMRAGLSLEAIPFAVAFAVALAAGVKEYLKKPVPHTTEKMENIADKTGTGYLSSVCSFFGFGTSKYKPMKNVTEATPLLIEDSSESHDESSQIVSPLSRESSCTLL